MPKRKLSDIGSDSSIDIKDKHKIPKIVEDTISDIKKEKYNQFENVFVSVLHIIIQHCTFAELFVLMKILEKISIKLDTPQFRIQNIIEKNDLNLFSLIAMFNRSDLISYIIKYMKFIDVNDAYKKNEYNLNSFDFAIQNNNIDFSNAMTEDKIKKYKSNTEKYKLHNKNNSITEIYKITLIYGDKSDIELCKSIYNTMNSHPINIIQSDLNLTAHIFTHHISPPKIHYIYKENYDVLLNCMTPLFNTNFNYSIFDILYDRYSTNSRSIKFLINILIIKDYDPTNYQGFYKKKFQIIFKNIQNKLLEMDSFTFRLL